MITGSLNYPSTQSLWGILFSESLDILIVHFSHGKGRDIYMTWSGANLNVDDFLYFTYTLVLPGPVYRCE